MTRYDFKIKQRVFRSGKIRSHGDFERFERGYRERKKNSIRWRTLVVMIALIFLIVIILFSVKAISASRSPYQHDLEQQNVNQIL